MTQRLTYHLESTNSLNDRQHGFREGKSVDTAINELLSKIQTARRDGKYVLVLSIDIKGAFDNLQQLPSKFLQWPGPVEPRSQRNTQSSLAR
ncbi:hypothetical protein AVEN_222608-1 [Araneus ventricosus]|uniref:Uncharacterized protein n=1 Tax=Araneus ventricosus TaxID=182803 RepID=A0A4Y2T4A1_ARAVE|nr:hypothetical protein AVEN_222608-1 [Araneus ventricosus]